MSLYFPVQWKTVIYLITEPNKPPVIPSIYCPASLPLFAKLSEKLVLKRISQLINIIPIVPNI